MKKIEFLIPQYKEDENIIKNLLDSIKIQQSIDFSDFKAIIVNDGSDVILNDDFLQSYPFEIEYLRQPHRGVSATRNAALQIATAEYVMFCDADDMFASVYGLFLLLEVIDKYHDDIYITPFTEATIDTAGNLQYVIHQEYYHPYLHGKIFKRKLIEKYHIRFPEYAKVSEDMYFCYYTQCVTKKVRVMPTSIYLWKWNPQSQSRQDPLFIVKTYNGAVRAFSDLILQFCMIGKFDIAIYFLNICLLDIYYTLNLSVFSTPEAESYVKDINEQAGFLYKKYKNTLYQYIDEDSRINAANDIEKHKQKQDILNGYTIKFSYKEWLKKIS